MSEPTRNSYLDQVVAQQQQLEVDLKARKLSSSEPAPPMAMRAQRRAAPSEPPQPRGSSAVEVRVSGFWRWKTVLVPPNAYVVHTRRGVAEPLHLGLGVSFRFNPATDSFLVVPGAMQTILINAYCICKELQGLVVQGYVQWLIQDFSTAYKKLDFGDSDDPMRLVNLQLKEQAEAAIKDKVATMHIHEVLSDKQPIIEELTARLRNVAEGAGGTDKGLGLRIVTVQIKEAIVSSARLWENLQKPFRAEQARIARLAELAAEEIITEKEMTAATVKERREMETQRELGVLRAKTEAETFDRDTTESLRRAQRAQEDARTLAEVGSTTRQHAMALEQKQLAAHAELAMLKTRAELAQRTLTQDGELALEKTRQQATHAARLLELELERVRMGIDNGVSEAQLQARLITALPQILEKLPKPNHLTSVTSTDSTSLSGVVSQVTGVLDALRGQTSRG